MLKDAEAFVGRIINQMPAEEVCSCSIASDFGHAI